MRIRFFAVALAVGFAACAVGLLIIGPGIDTWREFNSLPSAAQASYVIGGLVALLAIVMLFVAVRK